MRTILLALLPTFALGVASCCTGVEPEPQSTQIIVDEVSSGEAVAGLDTARTYKYRFVTANADSLLRLLVDRGIPVVRGWEAIDYLCKDAIGPRFTIELSRDDARVTAYDFERGEGRLQCSTRLKRYTVK